MTDDDFLQQLREAFAIEAAEHVQAIVAGLIELEKAPPMERRRAIVETIFRDAHSLKGAARAVSRSDIESVCQALESVFAAWKAQPAHVPVETFDTLNSAVDVVGSLLDGTAPPEAPQAKGAVAETVRQLGGLLAPQPAGRPTEAPAAQPTIEPPEATASRARHAPPDPTSAGPERHAVLETVRISMAKMDALLRQAQELVGVKLALRARGHELRETGRHLDEWRHAWAKVSDRATSPTGPAAVEAFLEWSRGFIHTLEGQVAALTKSAEHDERSISTLVDDLLDEAKELVMMPFGTLLDLFPKLVRDLARDEGKQIALTVTGREVEIDKRILEEVKDPLLHLVRNAIDHGLETPELRVAAGKPAQGALTLSVAQREGGKVEIVVLDDGAGIDAAKVRAAAVKSGVLSAEEAAALEDDAALQLIFQSGLSTSPVITEISGRGLGMAIVRDQVEKLGGQLSLGTRLGIGTSFRLLLPITLATFKGVLVEVGGQTFVIPIATVDRIVRVPRGGIHLVEGRETIELDGQPVSLARLGDILQISSLPEPEEAVEAVVIGAADKRVAFSVDAVSGEQEVLVKNIGKPLLRVRHVAGATVLGSGTPVVILNATDLLKSALRLMPPGSRGAASVSELPRSRRHILVADDSLTLRLMLTTVLESAGYRVTTANDGMEAWESLQAGAFDLLISDVEMPRLDGFGLTAKVRADPSRAELPVILVTALDSPEHRERGVQVGANAYVLKGNFDPAHLLGVVRELV